jgi:hypothetical protein
VVEKSAQTRILRSFNNLIRQFWKTMPKPRGNH